MSNIKTRKGLAFGALVALGASLIAGAPAHAAGELNVVPTAGTLLSTLSTETFSLNTNFTGSNATTTTINDLRYQVTTDNSVYVEAGANNATATSAAKVAALAPSAPASANNVLAITPVDSTKGATVVVTAYVDANNDNAFTAGEWNTVTTVNFKKLADVAAAVNLDTPHADDTKVTGQVTLDGINLTQIQSGVSVDVSDYDSTANVRVYTHLADATVTASTLKFTATVGALVAGDNIAARAYLGESETAFATATKKVVAHTVFHITASVTAGANATGGATSDVRANSPYVVTSTVTDNSSPDNLPVAGATVVADVATDAAPLSATKTLTINGKTYTSDADLAAASISLTSGADGKVALNVTTTGFVVGDGLLFHFVSENHEAYVPTEVVAARYTVIDAADVLDNDARSAVAGSTTKVTYTVVDQFGQAPANGKYAVAIEADGVTAAHADVVNGSATVDVAVAATPAIDSTWVEVALYAYATNDESFTHAVADATAINEDGFRLYVAPSNEITAATITLTSPLATTVKTVDSADKFAAHDGRFDGLFGYSSEPTVDVDAWQVFSGVVKAADVATHTIAGASVTITAPGQLVKSGDNYGVGSLTILVAPNGSFSFSVSSHKSGAQGVTVTSGAASATGSANWAALAASTVSATVASASYTSGRVVLVEFTTADKYGNAAGATGSATVAGAGYLVGAESTIGQTVELTTGTDGKGAVQLVNGADQIGTATVTASFFSGDAKKTAATTYTFGQTDANLNISGKRVTADWVFAAGKTVSITRDGVTIRVFHPTANTADSFSFNLKKSKHAHRVTIKINGVTVTDAGYLVKK
jgi:hypothetical protein